MPPIPRAFCAVLFTCALSLSPLFAQEGQSPETVDVEIVVTVTATRTPQPADEVPAAVTVITRQEIDAAGVETIDDLLRLIPGIDVARSLGPLTMTPRVSLRGMGTEAGRTLVMIDGVPVNKADTGSFNWNRIDPALVERIEVVPGPASGLWGSHAMGGVINIITRRPSEISMTELRVGAGTHDTLQGSLVTRGTAGSLGYRLHGHYLNTDGYDPVPANSLNRTAYTIPRDAREASLSVRLVPELGEHRSLVFDYLLYDDRRGEGECIQHPDGVYREFDTQQYTAQYRQRVGQVDLEARLYQMTEDYFWNRERMQGQNYIRYEVVVDRTERGAMLQASVPVASSTRLTTGLDYRLGSVDGADIYQEGPNAGLRVINQGKQRVTGLFAQYEVDLPGQCGLAVLGGRYDWASAFDGRFVDETYGLPDGPLPGGGWPEADWSAFSPKAGLKYAVTPRTNMWASAGRGFRPPILDELFRSGIFRGRYYRANPTLQPETVWSYEVGVNHRFSDCTTGRLTGYTSDAEDFLYAVLIDPDYDPRALYERRNIAEVRIRGVEAELTHRFSPAWGGFVNATWNASRIAAFRPVNPTDVDLTGNLLEYTPCQKYAAGVQYRAGAWLLGLTGRYVGDQYANPNNTARIDAYTAADLTLQRAVSPDWTIQLDIDNLGDNRFTEGNYYELRNGQWVNTDTTNPTNPYLRDVALNPGRTFTLSVKRSW
jgi:iron complex outermembrane receptor protein